MELRPSARAGKPGRARDAPRAGLTVCGFTGRSPAFTLTAAVLDSWLRKWPFLRRQKNLKWNLTEAQSTRFV